MDQSRGGSCDPNQISIGHRVPHGRVECFNSILEIVVSNEFRYRRGDRGDAGSRVEAGGGPLYGDSLNVKTVATAARVDIGYQTGRTEEINPGPKAGNRSIFHCDVLVSDSVTLN